ncbi:MAG: hypothetical protein HRT42_06845 [Campylobacteraceae bacterium]|nr:hypothetical protein [Campylobacteraceae bacterium]
MGEEIVLYSLGNTVNLQSPIPRGYEIGLAELAFRNTFYNIFKNERIFLKCFIINQDGNSELIGASFYNIPTAYYNSFEILKEALFFQIDNNVNNRQLQICQKRLLNRMINLNNQLHVLPAAVEDKNDLYVLSMTEGLRRFLGLIKSSIDIHSYGYVADQPINLNSKTTFDIKCEQILRTEHGSNILRSLAVNGAYNELLWIEFDNIIYRALDDTSKSFLRFNIDSSVQILYFTLFLRPLSK